MRLVDVVVPFAQWLADASKLGDAPPYTELAKLAALLAGPVEGHVPDRLAARAEFLGIRRLGELALVDPAEVQSMPGTRGTVRPTDETFLRHSGHRWSALRRLLLELPPAELARALFPATKPNPTPARGARSRKHQPTARGSARPRSAATSARPNRVVSPRDFVFDPSPLAKWRAEVKKLGDDPRSTELVQLASLLEGPYEQLVSRRMAIRAQCLGVRNLGELAMLDPAEVRRMRGMGALTVASVDEAFRRHTRRSWIELRRLLIAGPAEQNELAAFLAGSYEGKVPGRLARWLERRGMHTLRELAGLELTALPKRGIGRKTVAATDALFRAATGRSWDELRSLLHGESAPPPPVVPRSLELMSWDEFRQEFPAALRELPVVCVGLPPSLIELCTQHGVWTVDALLALSSEAFPRARLRRRRPTDIVKRRLLALLDEVSGGERQNVGSGTASSVLARSLAKFESWRVLLESRLASPPVPYQRAFARRAGVRTPRVTLREVGDELGVSRERARQLEAAAVNALRADWWPEALRQRILAELATGARDLEELGRTPFFADANASPELFDYVLEHILGGSARVVRLGARNLVARMPARAES